MDRPEQLVDPLWKRCFAALNALSDIWQRLEVGAGGKVAHQLRECHRQRLQDAIHSADSFFANLSFYKADAEKLHELMKDVEDIAGNIWCGSLDLGHFNDVRQILARRLEVYAGFEAYVRSLGKGMAQWFLDELPSMDAETAEQMKRDCFPGLARLYSGSLIPSDRKGYCPPRWTISKDHTGNPKMMVRSEDGSIQLASWETDLADKLLEDPTNLPDSFKATDMHDFGYIHDQVMLWGQSYDLAEQSLVASKKKYLQKCDKKQAWQAKAAKAREDQANGDFNLELPRELSKELLQVSKDKLNRSIDEMASEEKITSGNITARMQQQEREVDASTDDQEMYKQPMYSHPYRVDLIVPYFDSWTAGLRWIHNRRMDSKTRELMAQDYGVSHYEPQDEPATNDYGSLHVDSSIDANERKLANYAAAAQLKARLRPRAQNSQPITPMTPQHNAAPMSSAPPSKKSAPASMPSSVAKKLKSGRATLDSKTNRDSNFEMITVSNDPRFSPKSATGRPPLPSTTAPLNVPGSLVDLDNISDGFKTARGSSTTSSLTSGPLGLPDGPTRDKQLQKVQSTEVEPVPTTPRGLLSGVHSPQMADPKTPNLVTPSKQLNPAAIASRAAKKMAEAARATLEAKASEKLATASLQAPKPGSKRSREDGDTENPAVKRLRIANADSPVAPSSLQPTFVLKDMKRLKPAQFDNSVTPPSLLPNTTGLNLTLATLHCPSTPSLPQQVEIQQDIQPEVLARKRKRDADGSSPLDQLPVTKRRALSSQRHVCSSTVATHEKEEEEVKALLPPPTAFLGPDGKVQVNICKDRYSVRRVQIFKSVKCESLDLDMAEVEEPDYTIY